MKQVYPTSHLTESPHSQLQFKFQVQELKPLLKFRDRNLTWKIKKSFLQSSPLPVLWSRSIMISVLLRLEALLKDLKPQTSKEIFKFSELLRVISIWVKWSKEKIKGDSLETKLSQLCVSRKLKSSTTKTSRTWKNCTKKTSSW